jgi:hypothetical protein
LIFIACVLAALAAMVAAAAAGLRGDGERAARILKRLSVGAAAYLLATALISAATPRRIFARGEPQCNGEWCIAVAGVTTTPAAGSTRYVVALRLFTTAKRVAMREKGVAVHLLDAAGRRYEPRPDASAVPLDTRIAPGESVTAVREFELPADAADPRLVVEFSAGPGVVIGEVHWFRPPDVMRLY